MSSCFFRPVRYTCNKFIKLARARGHTYAQVVESDRDANGQPRQRNLLTLGRVDENNGQVDKILQTLL